VSFCLKGWAALWLFAFTAKNQFQLKEKSQCAACGLAQKA
jgi:hypothetical protein